MASTSERNNTVKLLETVINKNNEDIDGNTIIKNLERSVFNYSITLADEQKVIANWESKLFISIYIKVRDELMSINFQEKLQNIIAKDINEKWLINCLNSKNFTFNKKMDIRRIRVISLLLECLEKTNNFKKLQKSIKEEIVFRIEKSCYESSTENNYELDDIYNYKTSSLSRHLDLDDKLFCKELVDKLCLNKIEPEFIGRMKSKDFFPQKHKELEELIKSSNEITFTKKTSNLYKCKKCGESKTITENKQIRGTDEGATTTITCVFCQNSWTLG